MIGKFTSRQDEATLIALEELLQFRAEEAAHIGMFWEALPRVSLGAR